MMRLMEDGMGWGLGVCVLMMTLVGVSGLSAVVVSNETQLRAAVTAANSGGDTQIVLTDGTYNLTEMLYITRDGVSIRSQSGSRDGVVLRGQGMTGGVSHVIQIQATGVTIEDMTLGWVANHAIQIHGENNAHNAVMRNLHLVDTFEQMIKVSFNPAHPENESRNGLVEGCLFEYSAGIGPQWYIGGVDAHNAADWIVRGNTFRNICSPSGSVAEHAVHFWSNSRNTLVENNLIVDCDRGIGFGLGSSPHQGGVIRNNMICHHNRNLLFADVGISLESSSGTQVYHNTLYFENSYPNAVEYRFAATSGVLVVNNLCNKAVVSRDGGSGTVHHNVTNAQASWFSGVITNDLHLAYPVSTVVDGGTAAIPDLPVPFRDWDGQVRPLGAGPDIGADEYGSSLQLLSPNGGELWRRGETRSITWNAGGMSGTVVLELVRGAQVETIASVPATEETYSWVVGTVQGGAVSGSGWYLRIRSE